MKTVAVRRLVVVSLAVFAFSLAACNQTPDSVSTIPANADELLSPGPAKGQLKARDFGTAVDDSGRGVAANATGVYVVGNTLGSLDGPSKGDRDAFVRKYDGGVVWASQFGTRFEERAAKVVVDSTGNSYVLGGTYGALGFKVGGQDVYLRKYNASGTVLWVRQFGTNNYDDPIDLALDSSGNIFTLSQDNSSDGFTLRKFNANGVLLTSRTVTGSTVLPSLDPKALAIDSTGSVIVLAQWYVTGTGANVRVFKLTAALADVWNVPFQQTVNNDYAYDVTTFGTDIYLTAQIASTTAGYGARYGKLNSAGTFITARQLEPTLTCNCATPVSIALDASGNVYVAGYTAGSFTGFANAGAADIVAFKYNAAGIRQWVRQLGQGTNGTAEYDYAAGIAVSDDVYVTGYTYGNLLGDSKYSSGNDADAYLLQINKTTGAIVGIDQ
jgi:Beta-propeller repeat